jgi:NAD(P)-dependent dehydrogenase (short-subunit alcohol dehydrogenase family)
MQPIQANLSGRKAIVTGANTGLGKVIARELARLGADVTLACRNAEKAEAAKAEILAAVPQAKVDVQLVDVSSQASVKAFAAKFLAGSPKLDILVNNAGAWWMDRRESVDGIELQWATNVLGPQQLTQLLLPALKASGHGRIVNMASTAAGKLDLSDVQFKTRKYSPMDAYSATKQANRMLTWAQADRLQGSGITVNALSPGLVKTDLNRGVSGFLSFFFAIMTPLIAKTPEQGADTALWLAADPEVEGKSGKFWVDRKETACKFRNHDQQEALWQLCEAQLGGKAKAA